MRSLSRNYQGFPVDHCILAAERALFSFTTSFAVTHTPDGMTATAALPDSGGPGGPGASALWTIQVENVGSNTVRVTATSGGSPGVLRLYHARLAYVLGVRPDYISCTEALSLYDREGLGPSGFTPLCAFDGETVPEVLFLYLPGMPPVECNECP